MTLIQFLELYYYLAITLCGIGLCDKLYRLAKVDRPGHIPPAVTLVDSPLPRPNWTISRQLLLGPLVRFNYMSSRAWTCGYLFYHLAIILVVAGYTASAAIILHNIASGIPIPDFHPQLPEVAAHSTANILAFIFGNAEPYASKYLFGSFSPWFQHIAWFDFPLAIVGNACLLHTVLRRRVGAVRNDLDSAVRGIRLRGEFSGQHLLIRVIILSIILLEFMGRLSIGPVVAYYHAFLGLTLIAIFPYTYLVHIPLAPVVAWLAFQRRQRNAIA